MKWGVRKSDSTDVTTVSKRKLKKQVKQANKNPKNNKNTIAAKKAYDVDLLKTKEGQAYKNTAEFWMEAQAHLSKQNPKGRLVLNKEQADHFRTVEAACAAKGKELYETKYKDKFASAMLKDLGYDDTKAGRDHLKKYGFV